MSKPNMLKNRCDPLACRNPQLSNCHTWKSGQPKRADAESARNGERREVDRPKVLREKLRNARQPIHDLSTYLESPYVRMGDAPYGR